MLNDSNWLQWSDNHLLPDQVKRQHSAAGIKLTPLSLNSESCSAIFKGSGGKYTATLCFCDCTDFRRRKLPCKHMYRLAHELGIFHLPDNVAKSTAPPLNKDEALKLLQSSLNEDEQILFKRFCHECGNNNAGESLLPSSFADKLTSLHLAQEVTDTKILLKHLQMNLIRKFLPPGTKSPRTKADLISIVAPLLTKDDIVYENNDRCMTLHSSISHLGHTLHRRLCELYPDNNESS